MIPSHRKKLVRQKSINVPSPPPCLQSPFTWDNNLNWNHDTLTRSLSTESSTSQNSSSNPVVVPTKYFYRRR